MAAKRELGMIRGFPSGSRTTKRAAALVQVSIKRGPASGPRTKGSPGCHFGTRGAMPEGKVNNEKTKEPGRNLEALRRPWLGPLHRRPPLDRPRNAPANKALPGKAVPSSTTRRPGRLLICALQAGSPRARFSACNRIFIINMYLPRVTLLLRIGQIDVDHATAASAD
jgi:hypothetical protein